MKIVQSAKCKVQSGLSIAALTIVITATVLTGCAEKASEPERTTHPSGWTDTSSANFHGKFLAERGTPAGFQACLECHESFYSKSNTGVSCYGCHAEFPHPAGWSGEGSANLHQTYIQQKGWQLGECKACHGADFRTAKTFGDTTISCFSCHTGNSGPLGCRTCHGGTNSSAPPADLLGGTSTDLITVGAHQAHLGENSLSERLSCSDCHHRPDGFDDPMHIDTTTVGVAELTFGELATDSGRVTPVWDRTTGTCSSVYCHGAFDGGNMTNAPVWTSGSSQAQCGSCHSLPPTNHTTPEQQAGCYNCHTYSIATHVNGVVDLK